MASKTALTILICFVIVIFGGKLNAQALESPCPRLFVYEPLGDEKDRWYGIATLITDSDLTGVWLRLMFDSPPIQLGNWFGQVRMVETTDYLVNNRNYKLLANSPLPLRFYIKFDPSKPMPKLVGFRLNARTVCPEGQATTTSAPTATQLFTNKAVVAKPTPASAPVPVVPSQATNIIRPGTSSFISSSSGSDNEEDDYFHGDFYPNSKPSNIDSNIQCGTIAIQPQPLIAYGQKTKAGEFPWHAALYHSRGIGLNYICGGSLISRLHVITVAHCVSKSRSQSLLNTDNLLIYLGKYFLKKWSNPGVQTHQISKIIRHPHYDSSVYTNDMAIIKLSQAAEFSDYVRPVCLWEGYGDASALIGKYGTVVGWGFDEDRKLTEELTRVDMPIIGKEACVYSLPGFFSRFAANETYCAGYTNGTSVCNGDSGGGMVFQKQTGNPNEKVYYLRGMVSISVALQNQFKCDPHHYVVFTDVAKYLDFIKQSMRI